MFCMSLVEIKKNLKILAGQAHLQKDQKILDVILALDQSLEKEKANMDKKLIHFLQNRSYQKALNYIEVNGL